MNELSKTGYFPNDYINNLNINNLKQNKTGSSSIFWQKSGTMDSFTGNNNVSFWENNDANVNQDLTTTLGQNNEQNPFNTQNIANSNAATNVNIQNSDATDKKANVDINGKIEKFEQSDIEADCWLLSGVETLSNTKKGAQILKDSIKDNKDGTVTVHLKGANETYTFSDEAINNTEGNLSKGDDDVRAIELAVQMHRTCEILKGMKSGGYEGNGTLSDPLAQGYNEEAEYILTGKKAISVNPDDKTGSELDADYNKYLDLIGNDPEKYGGVSSFHNDDKANGIIANHSYSIKSVNNKNVTLTNPWDTDNPIVISRDEFKKNSMNFAFYS